MSAIQKKKNRLGQPVGLKTSKLMLPSAPHPKYTDFCSHQTCKDACSPHQLHLIAVFYIFANLIGKDVSMLS